MDFLNASTQTGKVIAGEKLKELTCDILAKFSEEKLSYDEAEMVLDLAKQAIGEYSKIEKIPTWR